MAVRINQVVPTFTGCMAAYRSQKVHITNHMAAHKPDRKGVYRPLEVPTYLAGYMATLLTREDITYSKNSLDNTVQ